VPVEETIIDVIEQPIPGAVVVSEYQVVSSDQEPQRNAGPETDEQ
jgi:hypothetical protein